MDKKTSRATNNPPAPSMKPRKRGRPPKAKPKAQQESEANVLAADVESEMDHDQITVHKPTPVSSTSIKGEQPKLLKRRGRPPLDSTEKNVLTEHLKSATEDDKPSMLNKNRKSNESQLDSDSSTTKEMVKTNIRPASEPESFANLFAKAQPKWSHVSNKESPIDSQKSMLDSQKSDASKIVKAASLPLQRKRGRPPKRTSQLDGQELEAPKAEPPLKKVRVLLKYVAKYAIGKTNRVPVSRNLFKNATKPLRVRVKRLHIKDFPSNISDSFKKALLSISCSAEAPDTITNSQLSKRQTKVKTQKERETEAMESNSDCPDSLSMVLLNSGKTSSAESFTLNTNAKLSEQQTITKKTTPKETEAKTNDNKTEPTNLLTANANENLELPIHFEAIKKSKGKPNEASCNLNLVTAKKLANPLQTVPAAIIAAKSNLETPVSPEKQKRRSKRCTLRASSICSNLTLEEIFAEIAAKTTKSITKTEASMDELNIDLIETDSTDMKDVSIVNPSNIVQLEQVAVGQISEANNNIYSNTTDIDLNRTATELTKSANSQQEKKKLMENQQEEKQQQQQQQLKEKEKEQKEKQQMEKQQKEEKEQKEKQQIGKLQDDKKQDDKKQEEKLLQEKKRQQNDKMEKLQKEKLLQKKLQEMKQEKENQEKEKQQNENQEKEKQEMEKLLVENQQKKKQHKEKQQEEKLLLKKLDGEKKQEENLEKEKQLMEKQQKEEKEQKESQQIGKLQDDKKQEEKLLQEKKRKQNDKIEKLQKEKLLQKKLQEEKQEKENQEKEKQQNENQEKKKQQMEKLLVENQQKKKQHKEKQQEEKLLLKKLDGEKKQKMKQHQREQLKEDVNQQDEMEKEVQQQDKILRENLPALLEMHEIPEEEQQPKMEATNLPNTETESVAQPNVEATLKLSKAEPLAEQQTDQQTSQSSTDTIITSSCTSRSSSSSTSSSNAIDKIRRQQKAKKKLKKEAKKQAVIMKQKFKNLSLTSLIKKKENPDGNFSQKSHRNKKTGYRNPRIKNTESFESKKQLQRLLQQNSTDSSSSGKTLQLALLETESSKKRHRKKSRTKSPESSKPKKELQRILQHNFTDSSLSGKTSESLQLALLKTESESSESASSSVSKSENCGLPTPTAELDAQNPFKFKLKANQKKLKDELAQQVADMETPSTTPSTSPQLKEEYSSVRRSHRIKQIPKMIMQSSDLPVIEHKYITMENQLAELANIEAINEQFLRQHGLKTFQTLQDNYYRCARQVSPENAEMQCDCVSQCGSSCINRMLMIECGPTCTSGPGCTNKRFQQHQCWPGRVFRTHKKGCGVKAELMIPPGEFIMEYVGEVIDSEESERRRYLYDGDSNHYFMSLRGELMIDSYAKGNISRFINHSCDPNAMTEKWTVNGELRIGFFSLKTIMPGEEITFDYQYKRYGRQAQRCFCEASNCRGWVGSEPESDDDENTEEEEDEEEEEGESEVEEVGEKMDKQKSSSKCIKSNKLRKHLKLSTVRKQRKHQSKDQQHKDREYKAGRWLRPSNKHKSTNPHIELEDSDVRDQLMLLNNGLKNQKDTLRFSRCVVRAKLLQTRLQLLGVLSHGELACRRLFLDYHGLRLLHAWISESGSNPQLRLAMLNALESLPIPNKTVLSDSRVYQSVQLWTQEQLNPLDTTDPDPVHQQRMLALLQKWNALPEVFRIPKLEKIKQMQQHEREADRTDRTLTALEESNSNSNSAFVTLNSNPYIQDRFRRDTFNRYDKPKPHPRPTYTNTNPNNTISKELRRSLFEKMVAEIEAEKRVPSEDWKEHVARCEQFGYEVSADPQLLPFAVNIDTNEWFNKSGLKVPDPPRCLSVDDEEESDWDTEEKEDKEVKEVKSLPLSWNYGTSEDGSVYYYNLKDRIPQWEPPSAQQRLQKLVDTSSDEGSDNEEESRFNIDPVHLRTLSPNSKNQYIEDKVRERREWRKNRRESVREISPRREEDRLWSQQESRKYKENKEKIRRRREIYFNNRNENNKLNLQSCIPRYLLSSDEDEDGDGDINVNVTASNGAQLPTLDTNHVKHVDEMEALSQDSRPLSLEPSTSKSALNNLLTHQQTQPEQKFKPMTSLLSLPLPPLPKSISISISTEVAGFKHKLSSPDYNPDEKRCKMNSTPEGREACEKFRLQITDSVANYLLPYYSEACVTGRITCDADYQYLIKELSRQITTKEMRYCDKIGYPFMKCTESVKRKTFVYISLYMQRKGSVYKKPEDETDN